MSEEVVKRVDEDALELTITAEEASEIIASLDASQASTEVFWWLTSKVTDYVDSHKNDYYLTFLSDEEHMPVMAKLESLCRELQNTVKIDLSEVADTDDVIKQAFEDNEEIDEESKITEMVVAFLEKVREIMSEDKERLQALFETISHFYKMVGVFRGTPVKKDLQGYVKIEYLSFENVEMMIKSTPMREVKNEEGETIDVVKDESASEVQTMLPSFTIDLLVDIWEDQLLGGVF